MGLRIYGTIVVEVSAQVVRCRTAIAGNLSAIMDWRNSNKVFFRAEFLP